jgi:membrane protein YdbS with pleckstrin-like domain
MEKINENIELEQMKEQLSILKKKLENESILNDRLMRKAMSEKVSKINHDAIAAYIIIFFAIPYCTWVFIYLLNLSWWFCGVTDIFLLIALIYTYISHRGIRSNEILEGNLLEVSYKIARMKKMYADWLKIGIPFLVIWIIWFVLEVLHNSKGEEAHGVLIGGAVGAVIGVVIGSWKYRRIQRKAKEVIEQIHEQCKE